MYERFGHRIRPGEPLTMYEGSIDHPATDRLAAYGLALLGEPEASRIARHLAKCPGCRSRLAALSGASLASLAPTVIRQRRRGEMDAGARSASGPGPSELPTTVQHG